MTAGPNYARRETCPWSRNIENIPAACTRNEWGKSQADPGEVGAAPRVARIVDLELLKRVMNVLSLATLEKTGTASSTAPGKDYTPSTTCLQRITIVHEWTSIWKLAWRKKKQKRRTRLGSLRTASGPAALVPRSTHGVVGLKAKPSASSNQRNDDA